MVLVDYFVCARCFHALDSLIKGLRKFKSNLLITVLFFVKVKILTGYDERLINLYSRLVMSENQKILAEHETSWNLAVNTK